MARLLNEGLDRLVESYEPITENKNLSSKSGTLSSELTKHSDEVASLSSKDEIIKFLSSIEDSVSDKKYLEKVKTDIMKKRSAIDALSFLYDIILSGDGEETIKTNTKRYK